MKRIISWLAVSLTAAMLLTGCGCMGCGGSDYADDGVIDGSAGSGSTDGVTGGDSSTAGNAMNAADDVIDGARNAVDELFGTDGTSPSRSAGAD